mmetsp:Transcript_45959/g.142300  ORF Transcript_45959/g.142300 Transcript_45959/m.142300 type:complete len:131 (+) Transcript_45959:182-574(+)
MGAPRRCGRGGEYDEGRLKDGAPTGGWRGGPPEGPEDGAFRMPMGAEGGSAAGAASRGGCHKVELRGTKVGLLGGSRLPGSSTGPCKKGQASPFRHVPKGKKRQGTGVLLGVLLPNLLGGSVEAPPQLPV